MGDFWKGVGDFFGNVGNTVKDAACAVGNFVKDTACDIGKGAWSFVTKFPEHVTDAFNDGTSRFGEGVEQIKNGAGFSGFVSCLGGAIHAFTPSGWLVDTVNDVALENTDLVTDELGNSSYVAKEGASTGLFSSMFRGFANTDLRTQETISEAMESGDAGAANMAMLGQIGSTGTQVLSQALMTAGIVCDCTGVGAPVGLALQGGSLLVGMGSTYIEDSLKADDLAKDIDRAVEADVKRLTDSGQLSEENKDDYTEYLTKFYNTESVNGLGQTGCMSKEDFELLAAGNGLLNMSYDGMRAEGYPGDASAGDSYGEFRVYYADAVAKGLITDGQADRLSSLGSMYTDGDIDGETYYTNMHMIQYENYDLTEEQAMTLAVMDAYADLGYITQEEHRELLFSEPVFQDLIRDDGRIHILPKQDEDRGLSKLVSDDAQAPGPEAKPTRYESLLDSLSEQGLTSLDLTDRNVSEAQAAESPALA